MTRLLLGIDFSGHTFLEKEENIFVQSYLKNRELAGRGFKVS